VNFCQLPENYLRKLLEAQNLPYVFLETLRFDRENKTSFLFGNFIDLVTFRSGDDLDKFFRKIEGYLNKGYWLSGYFSYEFGYCLEPRLQPLLAKGKQPLVWLGVSKAPKTILNKRNNFLRQSQKEALALNRGHRINNLHPNISHSHYLKQIERIKDYLSQGLTYQVNFTFKVKFDFEGDYLDCYLNLRRSQPSSYAALINTDQTKIISLSPELFFRINGKKIVARPMKGTSKRGVTLKQDQQLREELLSSIKTRAENIMIVDLLRNDLGRISQSVSVPNLFEIEKYRTLYQMTSIIKARLKNNLKLKDLFSSLFPCGSVTGAPKIKTMQIISGLEKEPRGVYTGAIGYISPKRDACFNVAIRTISLKNKEGEMGIGGGVVYDSIDRSEYEEALLKAKFFVEGFPQIKLIETLLLVGGRYPLLDLHLKRLKASSEYFLVSVDISRVKKALLRLAGKLRGKFKVRLLVDLAGEFKLEEQILEEVREPVKATISSQRMDPNNSFLYHKTTKRKLYDQERKKANLEGFFEVVFLNIYGELTEGSITNIFVSKKGKLYTPPLKCGLLPGVLREDLLKKRKAREKVLYEKDVFEADKVYLGNSLRGLLEAEIIVGRSSLKAIEKARKS